MQVNQTIILIFQAICNQYKAFGPSDKLPRTNLGKLVSLIDKTDTLAGFFIIGKTTY